MSTAFKMVNKCKLTNLTFDWLPLLIVLVKMLELNLCNEIKKINNSNIIFNFFIHLFALNLFHTASTAQPPKMSEENSVVKIPYEVRLFCGFKFNHQIAKIRNGVFHLPHM